MPFAKFTPTPRINVDHSLRHYGHFVSGQHCAAGRGDVLPGVRIWMNSQKTVKCPNSFATDCRFIYPQRAEEIVAKHALSKPLYLSPFLFFFSLADPPLFFPRSVQNRSSVNTTPPSHSSSTWRSRTSTRPCKRQRRTFRSTASSRTRRDARTQPWWTSWTRRSAIWRERSKRRDSGTTRLQSSRLTTEELTWGEGTTGLCAERKPTCGREGCVGWVLFTARCFKPRVRRPEGWCTWQTGTQPSSTLLAWALKGDWTV